MRISINVNEDHHAYSGEVTVPGDDRLVEMGIEPGEPLVLVTWVENVLQSLFDGEIKITQLGE